MTIYEIATIYIYVSCGIATLISIYTGLNYGIVDSYLLIIGHIDTFESIITKIAYSIVVILPITVMYIPALMIFIPLKLFLDKYN